MSASLIHQSLYILGTIDTIREYTAKKRTPYLGPLLDDIVGGVLRMIAQKRKQSEHPTTIHHLLFTDSNLRILDYLIEEAIRNNRPDIADEFRMCKTKIANLNPDEQDSTKV